MAHHAADDEGYDGFSCREGVDIAAHESAATSVVQLTGHEFGRGADEAIELAG